MYNFEEIKNVVEQYKDSNYQIFNTMNLVGDSTEEIYNKDGVLIFECEYYGYLEVFGLSEKDFDLLCDKEDFHRIKIK